MKSNSNLHIGFEYPDLPNPDGTMELNSIINLTNEYLDGLNDYIREFNWKNITAIASLILVPMLIIVWATCVRVF